MNCNFYTHTDPLQTLIIKKARITQALKKLFSSLCYRKQYFCRLGLHPAPDIQVLVWTHLSRDFNVVRYYVSIRIHTLEKNF